MVRNPFFAKLYKGPQNQKKAFGKELHLSNPQQFQSTIYQSSEKKEEENESIMTNHENFLDYNFNKEQILDNFDFAFAKRSKSILQKTGTILEKKNEINLKHGHTKINNSPLKKNKTYFKID